MKKKHDENNVKEQSGIYLSSMVLACWDLLLDTDPMLYEAGVSQCQMLSASDHQ